MEKSSDSKSIHIPLTLLIIAGAFLLRMTGLGGSSLTMNEAENAMAALRLFGNGGNSQLLYTLPTALFFKMFGSSEFTARLFPALMGCLLAGLPLVLKNQIGSRKAFILGLLLAADPVLIFWSKRADAVIPAVTLPPDRFMRRGTFLAGIGSHHSLLYIDPHCTKIRCRIL